MAQGDAAASSPWHHHTSGFPDFVGTQNVTSLTLPPLLPSPPDLSACWVCAGNSFVVSLCCCLALIQHHQSEFWGTGLMQASNPVKQGFPLGIEHQGITSGCTELMEEAGAQHKGLQGFTGQGKAAHKQCNDFCPDSQEGISSLTYCCTERKLC